LLFGGSSEERYAYSTRGLLASIDSSYGRLISGIDWDPQDAPTRIVFGDARKTTATFVYDDRHRLSICQLMAPPLNGASPIGFFDFRFNSYDAVGNPLEIEDTRIAWTVLPPEAAPVEKRSLEYDNLYRLTQSGSTYKTAAGLRPGHLRSSRRPPPATGVLSLCALCRPEWHGRPSPMTGWATSPARRTTSPRATTAPSVQISASGPPPTDPTSCAGEKAWRSNTIRRGTLRP
jgi:hypothetical protein